MAYCWLTDISHLNNRIISLLVVASLPLCFPLMSVLACDTYTNREGRTTTSKGHNKRNITRKPQEQEQLQTRPALETRPTAGLDWIVIPLVYE